MNFTVTLHIRVTEYDSFDTLEHDVDEVIVNVRKWIRSKANDPIELNGTRFEIISSSVEQTKATIDNYKA